LSVTLELIDSNLVFGPPEIEALEKFYEKLVIRHVLEIEDPLMRLDQETTDNPLYVPIDNGSSLLLNFELGHKKPYILGLAEG